MGTVHRNIYFFQIRFQLVQKQKGKDVKVEVAPQDVSKALSKLKYTNPDNIDSRYSELEDGDWLSVETSRVKGRIQGAIGRTRRNSLPQIDQIGKKRLLTLGKDEGLYDPSHFVIFSDGIIGFEWSFYGPKLPRLATYLTDKLNSVVNLVEFQMLLYKDYANKLNNINEVTAIGIEAHRDISQLIRAHSPDLGRAFNIMRNANQFPVIKIEVGVERYKRKGFPLSWIPGLKELLDDPAARHGLEALWIRAKDPADGETKLIDLLKDKLVARKPVIKVDDVHRTVLAASMFDAIITAREELKETLDEILEAQV